MLASNFSALLQFLVFAVIVYIIARYFWHQKMESKTSQDIDDLIRKKRYEFESTVPSNPVQKKLASNTFFDEIAKRKQWGGLSEVQKFLSNQLSNMLGTKLELLDFPNFNEIETDSEELFKQELLSRLLVQHLGHDSISLASYDSYQVRAAILVLLGESEQLFKRFDGSKQSLKHFNYAQSKQMSLVQSLQSMQFKEILFKIQKIIEEIKPLFKADFGEIENKFQKVEDAKGYFRELSKTYHPDSLPLHLISKNQQDKFLKIYSEQFSKIQELYQKSTER